MAKEGLLLSALQEANGPGVPGLGKKNRSTPDEMIAGSIASALRLNGDKIAEGALRDLCTHNRVSFETWKEVVGDRIIEGEE